MKASSPSQRECEQLKYALYDVLRADRVLSQSFLGLSIGYRADRRAFVVQILHDTSQEIGAEYASVKNWPSSFANVPVAYQFRQLPQNIKEEYVT